MTGAPSEIGTAVLAVSNLTKHFIVKNGFWGKSGRPVRAVDGVDLHIDQGETLAIVGESGSGKTTLGRMIVRAIEPTSGSVHTRGTGGKWIDLTEANRTELREARRNLQMIFQDPFSSLNPRMTVEQIVGEPLANSGMARGRDLRGRVIETLELVGLGAQHLHRYPNAFSGGQRQRIGIARSLVSRPKVIVCDEAVSALDVSVQAQILNLLKDLQEQLGISFLFISHDLNVVEYLAQRVAVMYVGRIVEVASTESLFRRPRHPYTEALLSSIPVPEARRAAPQIVLKGEVANPADPPSGCYFHPRCPYATARCAEETPALREITPGHLAACHYAEKLDLSSAPMDAQIGIKTDR